MQRIVWMESMTTRSGFSFRSGRRSRPHHSPLPEDVILRHFQPGSAQLDLPHRFLASDIQNAVLVGNGTAQLQKHSRFAHTRLTAQSTTPPSTMPPPSTRSSSEMPVRIRLFFGHADLRRRFAVRVVTLPGGRLPPVWLRQYLLWGFRYNVLVHRVPAAAAGSGPSSGACLAAVGTHIQFSVLVPSSKAPVTLSWLYYSLL